MDATFHRALALDFDKVRPMFGGHLSQGQVDGINTILSAFEAMGDGQTRHLAYMLATAKHETADAMLPIREWGRGQGRPYGKPDATGQIPYGRGLVQLTWDYNYLKADKELGLNGALVKNYDLALQPDIASKIMVRGMQEGWFTGHKLSDYPDFLDMRRVINGLDRAQTIAIYANTFLGALS